MMLQNIVSTIPAECAYFNASKLARVLTRTYDNLLKPSGLSAGQFSLLASTSLNKNATVTALAQKIGIERTTLTRNLHHLTTKGFVQTDRQGRSQHINITGAGQQALIAALPLWQKAQKQVNCKDIIKNLNKIGYKYE